MKSNTTAKKTKAKRLTTYEWGRDKEDMYPHFQPTVAMQSFPRPEKVISERYKDISILS